MMGGAAHLGNVTPAAEFNLYVDPEAASVVFESGVPVTMVGLDVTYQARIMTADRERIRALGSTVGTMIADLLGWFAIGSEKRFGWEGVPVHDALAVAAVIRPDLLQTKHCNVVDGVERHVHGGQDRLRHLGHDGPRAERGRGARRQPRGVRGAADRGARPVLVRFRGWVPRPILPRSGQVSGAGSFPETQNPEPRTFVSCPAGRPALP